MAKENTKKPDSIDESKIEIVETTQNLDVPKIPIENKTFDQEIAPYIAFLEAMKVTKKHLDTAPTLTPKNFYDQIQFYDTGGVRRLYLYINGTWRYVVLT